jgi:hypothetical protein
LCCYIFWPRDPESWNTLVPSFPYNWSVRLFKEHNVGQHEYISMTLS